MKIFKFPLLQQHQLIHWRQATVTAHWTVQTVSVPTACNCTQKTHSTEITVCGQILGHSHFRSCGECGKYNRT